MRAWVQWTWQLTAVAVCAVLLHLPVVQAATPAAPQAASTAAPTTASTTASTTALKARPPPRLISLVPSLTEAVCLLQACDLLVGVDRHSNWPASVQGLPKLGGLDDTPLEQLVALRPSLVLLPPSSRLIPRLKELGIETLALPTQSHADVRAALNAIGARLQRSAVATQLWNDAQADIRQAAQRIPEPMRGRRVYVEVSSEPHAAGPSSFIGQTLQQLGLRNIAPEELGPFPRLNPEFIVRAQPDVVIASSASFEKMPTRPGWAGLKALNDKACSLPPQRWEVLVRPGPRLGTAAHTLADCLSQVGLGKRTP
jgi:iron complex transport system substrate-binding protein